MDISQVIKNSQFWGKKWYFFGKEVLGYGENHIIVDAPELKSTGHCTKVVEGINHEVSSSVK